MQINIAEHHRILFQPRVLPMLAAISILSRQFHRHRPIRPLRHMGAFRHT